MSVPRFCEPDGEPNFCSLITANPDISGKGVRIAIYSQTFISMMIASWLPYHEKAFRDTSRNCYVVSGSLIIASLIAWKTKGLSLFDGLITTMVRQHKRCMTPTNFASTAHDHYDGVCNG
ncbi:hypothetical protein FRC12_008437 [Ceratobasidium sp. 428]|nr:hypothetical protein FRC12_008437 [Ceratobasidium sp. 428]